MAPPSPERRADVLRRICDLLPDDDARFVRSLDPADYQTYLHAYVAVRRHGAQLDPVLRQQIVQILFAFHDARARTGRPS